MIATSKHSASEADHGFTLIELLVYCALSVLVLVIVGGFLASSLKTGRTVRESTQSTTAAQLIATSVQTGVRNASAVKAVTEANGGRLILARTAGSAADDITWVCQAWYYDPATHAVYTTTVNPAAAITVPASGPAGHWTLLSTGVAPAPGGSGAVFSGSSASIALDFTVSLSGEPAAVIDTDAYLRNNSTESAPCF